MLLWLGMLFPSSARKASTVAFGLGNISKEKKNFKRKQSKKKNCKAAVFWEACSEIHTVVLSCQFGTCTRREREHLAALCLQEPSPSHQHGKLDCSTTQGRLIPKTPVPNPLKTSSVSDQYGFLAQRFSLLPPALQQAQDPVWLPFLWCCTGVLSSGRSL